MCIKTYGNKYVIMIHCIHIYPKHSHTVTHYITTQVFERKIINIFLPISLNICYGCSKEMVVSWRLKKQSDLAHILGLHYEFAHVYLSKFFV